AAGRAFGLRAVAVTAGCSFSQRRCVKASHDDLTACQHFQPFHTLVPEDWETDRLDQGDYRSCCRAIRKETLW
ncbi:hypothetical protein AAFF_G00188930, partial [Aldrovandia affinis]